jgi:hypothetical protein
MGWIYMKSLKGHAGPRDYLDAQFTCAYPDATSKILCSELIDGRVYYAAVEQVDRTTGERTVWALVCLVHYNPRDHDGDIFGYTLLRSESGISLVL